MVGPEGLAHALESYVKTLQHQLAVAASFYYGRVGEGMDGLQAMPEHVRLRIDQILWESTGGELLDLEAKEGRALMWGAILQSIEERMGIT
ncbi:MAG: hypothetical protein RL235_789 [Chlamydiota bacterium]|jgi:hypothetical protein